MNAAKIMFPLVTLPYLTRTLTVECFGFVAFISALMKYIQIFVDFGFMLSGTRDIVLARDDSQKLGYIVGDILLARCIISFCALIILLCISYYIDLLVDNKAFTILSFVVVFLSCFFLDYLFRGLEIMEFITIRFVVMKAVATVFTFVMVKSDADILWIPILDILGSFLAIGLVWKQIHELNVRVKISCLNSALSKIKDSAVFFFSEVSTTAFGVLNILVIGLYLPVDQVSYWSICMQLVSGVQSFYTPITGSIYPEMIKSKNLKIISKVLLVFLPIISIGCILTYYIADYAVVIIAGDKYLPAAYLLRLLIPVMFLGFLSMLYGWPVLGAIEKQKEVTMTTMSAALFQCLGLFILITINSFTLFNIAIIRGFTEFFLFIFRYYFFVKHKNVFRFCQ